MKFGPATFSLAMVVLTVLAYEFVAQPAAARFSRLNTDSAAAREKLEVMEMEIANRERTEQLIAELEARTAERRRTFLVPMLNSNAMRAKSVVDAFAREAGLLHIEYNEGDLRALPLQTLMPSRRTARRSVRINALGDYAAAASFLLRVERELPHVALQSLQVASSPASPDVQSVEIVFEWPAEGEVIK